MARGRKRPRQGGGGGGNRGMTVDDYEAIHRTGAYASPSSTPKSTGWEPHDDTPDLHTEVKGGVERRSGKTTTEHVIAPKDHSGDRQHVVHDDQGNETLNEWHEGNRR